MAQASNLRIILIGLVSLAVAMGIGRFAFTPLLPLMQDDGLLSLTGGGVLASVHFLGYWLGAVFAARIPWSPRSALRLSLLTIAVGTLGMGVTDSFSVWLALRWLCGVGSAFTLVLVSNFYIKHLADAGRAEKQSWIFSGVGAGIAAAGLGALALMESQIGSRQSWQIFGILTLPVVLAVCILIGREIPGCRPEATYPQSPRTPLIWSTVIAYGAAGIGYSIPATYLPVMAREIVPSPLISGWGWPAFGMAAFVSTLLAAQLRKRFSNRQIWAASQIVMAAGLLLPVVHSGIEIIIVAAISVGGTFMIITMAGMQEAHRIAPAQDVMRHIAAMTAAFATGQMIGPVFASAIHDLTESFAAALLITSVALFATATALLAGASRKPVIHSSSVS